MFDIDFLLFIDEQKAEAWMKTVISQHQRNRWECKPFEPLNQECRVFIIASKLQFVIDWMFADQGFQFKYTLKLIDRSFRFIAVNENQLIPLIITSSEKAKVGESWKLVVLWVSEKCAFDPSRILLGLPFLQRLFLWVNYSYKSSKSFHGG